MKKALFTLFCLAAMLAAGMSLKAQEVTITLNPGWTWISVPITEVQDFETTLGSFTPVAGDMIKSQWGNATYRADGSWRGSISQFYPGYGYKYYSNRTAPVTLTFNVQQPAPQVIVTTLEIIDITANSAFCGGNVASSNGDYVSVTLRGICWSTNPNPTFNDNYIEAENGLGNFTVSMTELTPNTTYYVRAFAVTPTGTFYGDEESFTTLDEGLTIPVGAINGSFSVSENNQVYFSQGNLQYQASTNTWRFAENQWDYVGDAGAGTVFENGIKCNNILSSPTYNGWIDLFAWGTSGYNHGANCYQPWSTSTNNNNYYAYGNCTYNLYDQTGQADWGYNAISNGGNQEKQWRTLTYNEWDYLFFTRSTISGIRFVRAVVNGVFGIVIFPDNWDSSTYVFIGYNSIGLNNNENTISVSDWETILEPNGAVFLPGAGRRDYQNSWVDNAGYICNYWSSTYYNDEGAFCVDWYLFGAILPGAFPRGSGRSVRLVQAVQSDTSCSIEAVPNPVEGGTVTGTGNYSAGQNCTITATPNEGYNFVNWTENGEVVSSNPTYSFIVEGNRTLVANFSYNGGGDTYAYVDLGLPSGLLWATCNIGADFPEDYGDYYAWGETTPKDYYHWSNYQYCNGNWDMLTKYCSISDYGYNGFTDNLTALLPEDDAATANWGSGWRIPTVQEWEELYQNTDHSWTTYNGVNGMLFIASNGNSLFLPAAGCRSEYGNYDVGNLGLYLSTSFHLNCPPRSCENYFGLNGYGIGDLDRDRGLSIRPVRFAPNNNAPTGAINGKFTINANGNQVYFSQGNLQYRASSNTWRFAENQQDVIGNSNSNISPTYDGWIDLFGWGTSGYDNKYPWMTSEIETDYGDNQNNIAYTEYDWGQHNPISNGGNQAGLWRTLSSAEMNYMIYQRPNASNLYAMGLVNGRHGLIIFPDNFEMPNGMSFTPAYKLWSNDINNYSLNQWSMLETNGAVFLPVAGVRNGTTVSEEDESGYYWSTDILTSEEGAKEMWFGRMYIYYNPGIGGWASRHVGYSVRLVTDAE